MRDKLVSRGYGKAAVEKQIRKGSRMSRGEALKRVERNKGDERIYFVTTQSAYLPNINQILRRHAHYLDEDGLGRYMGTFHD